MTKINPDIISKSIFVRRDLQVDCSKPINIYEILKQRDDYTIVFVPLSPNIQGFSHNDRNHKIIIINANNSLPQQNFSFAHELYHLYFNYENNKLISDSKDERLANIFAGALLIPREALYIYIQDNNIDTLTITDAELCAMERYFGVSRSALVIRLHEEGLITEEQKRTHSTNIKIKAAHNGFDTSYYEQKEDKYEVVGKYLSLAKELYDEGKITLSKYQSYLIDAFKADMVFNPNKDQNGNN